MTFLLLPIVLVAAGLGYGLRPELASTPTMWMALAGPYAVLSAVALWKLYDDGTLLDRLRFKSGDITLGIVLAGLLFGAAWLFRNTVLPRGSDHAAWLFRLYLQLGNVQQNAPVVAGILLIGLAEELVWRGLVLDAAAERFGARPAWLVASLAYALAHLPTAFTLADPSVGPNPLLVVAALGCGGVWSFAASVLGRLPPVMVSHVVFSYFALLLLLPRF